MRETVGAVLLEENAWFRQLMLEVLPDYGVTVLAAERDGARAMEAVERFSAPVLLYTLRLADTRCRGLYEILTALPAGDVPAAVILGDTFTPGGPFMPAGCRRVGKDGGAAAIAGAARQAAGERKRFLAALRGALSPEETAAVLLETLGFTGTLAGEAYLRGALPMAARREISAKEIYVTLGEESGAAPGSVERDMRYAVRERWGGAPIYARRLLLGDGWERTPANFALISRLGRVLAGGIDKTPEMV